MQAFRQHYENDTLDAATLLIPITGFLPADDSRVISTIERIATQLSVGPFVFRFDPQKMAGDVFKSNRLPLVEFEGAFLPCTFWLAACYAKLGRIAEAEAIVTAVEQIAGATGLLAEAVDPRDGAFSGQFPSTLFACRVSTRPEGNSKGPGEIVIQIASIGSTPGGRRWFLDSAVIGYPPTRWPTFPNFMRGRYKFARIYMRNGGFSL